MAQKRGYFSICAFGAVFCSVMLAPFSFAYAESQNSLPAFPSVIPPEIQKGINVPVPLTNILQNLFQAPPVRLPQSSVPASPQLESGLRNILQGVQSVIRLDGALQRLNAEIKQKLGIDVPVLAGALWDGIVWLVYAIVDLVTQAVSR